MVSQKHEQKVKEVKKAKGLAGEHLGAPPYGYLRNPDDKTRWLVDGEAAAVVRRIFSLCMQGKGVSAIATTLWKDRTLTPSAYKASKGIGVAKVSGRPVLLGNICRSRHSGKRSIYRHNGKLQIHKAWL